MTGPGLEGKRAILTGAASGIGAVVAGRFLDAGAEVAVCDIDDRSLETFSKQHPKAHVFQCDVRDPEAVERTLEGMKAALGAVDILVNCAGTAGPTAFVSDISPDDWSATIDCNLTSQFLFIRGVVEDMAQRGGGAIINMSSAAGRLGMPMRTPYVAAKWGIIGLTQSLAMELGPKNIRVNAILPGSVRGERMDRVMQARAKATGLPLSQVEAEEVANISLGRMIEPEEIADLILFACAETGRSISGQSLGVCGNTELLR